MGIREDIKRAWKKRQYDRRVENMFKSPQGFDRRKAKDRRLLDIPIQTIEPPE
jgi:hypothetical protein